MTTRKIQIGTRIHPDLLGKLNTLAMERNTTTNSFVEDLIIKALQDAGRLDLKFDKTKK